VFAVKDSFLTSYEFESARRRLTDLSLQLGATDNRNQLREAAVPEEEISADTLPAEARRQWNQEDLQTLQNVNEYKQRAKSQELFNRAQVAQQFQQVAAPAASQASASQTERSEKYDSPGTQLDSLNERPLTIQTRSDELPVVQGELVARWIGPSETPQLVIERQVSIGPRVMTQGFLLDWPALRATLIESAGNLLPGFNIVPAGPAQSADPASLGRRLAAIPAELTLPPHADIPTPDWSPLRTTLVVTWIAALAGVAAIGAVLHTSLELAERRGRFVSAVTHELRTPLTTFCMYSQLLADGMVTAPEDQRSYFNTLRTESQRLARIVESVLDYARLGRSRTSKAIMPMRVGELIDQCSGSLAARCEEAGMLLVIERGSDADRVITTDSATVERVLFNLVDNACKYAIQTTDRRVHLEVRVSPRDVAFLVRDHGPGIASEDRARIFRPFVRGKSQADGSISGLGLGLALARGLAEQLGGELRLTSAQPGTEFVLKLPLDA
jgi:signal transduction histidine kinase